MIDKITDVWTAHLDNSLVMEELFRMASVDKLPKTAMLREKFNLANNHAINAEDVHHQLSCVLVMVGVSVKYQDQHANATNNTEQLTTDVLGAHQVNYQVMVVLFRTVSAEYQLKTVLQETEFNWDKRLAIDANHALMVKFQSTVFVWHQESAIATSNTTEPPTLAQTAHQVNWAVTDQDQAPTQVFAELLNRAVIKEAKSNWVNNNATDADHANQEKSTSHQTSAVEDQHAVASNTSTLKTSAKIAQLANSLTQADHDV